MIVHDFNIKNISILPAKTNPPLVIDADAVLSFTVTFQGFQPVAGRDLEVLQPLCLMQEQELASGDTLNGPEPWHVLVVEQGLGPGVAEGADHYRSAYYAKRDMSSEMGACGAVEGVDRSE